MKIISKDDLLLLIPLINDRDSYSMDDFETLLDRFGDDWFMEDGRFTKTTENKEMIKIRNKCNKEKEHEDK